MNDLSYSFNLFSKLVQRHLKVLLTNAIRLFYTLLVPIVLLVVYFLFLRELEVSTVESELLKRGIMTTNPEFISNIKTIIDSWMLSGVIALSSITISLQICSLIVEDRTNKVSRDFVASPIKKNILVLSYFVYLFIVTFVLSFIVLIVDFICLLILGEFHLSFLDVLLLILLLLFTTILACLTALLVSSLVKSEPVLASISAIFSTAAGFLIGAYMPLSMLPVGIQYFCLFVPWTYSCSLLRFAFLAKPLANLESFLKSHKSILPSNIKYTEIVNELGNNFSYKLNFFGVYLEPIYEALINILFIIIFASLCLIFSKRLFILDEARARKK